MFQNDILRYLATALDILIIFLILGYCEYKKSVELNFLLFLPLFLLTLNSILESMLGSSMGKLILGIEVVNDDCKHLSVFESFKRNLLKLILFIPLLFSDGAIGSLDYFDKQMIIHGIYIIARKEKSKIRERMKSSESS